MVEIGDYNMYECSTFSQKRLLEDPKKPPKKIPPILLPINKPTPLKEVEPPKFPRLPINFWGKIKGGVKTQFGKIKGKFWTSLGITLL